MLLVIFGSSHQHKIWQQDKTEDCRKNDERNHHRVSPALISFTCSNMSTGSGIPEEARRSAHFGRIPVARNRPITFPSGVIPVRSNTKISCIVITSPSIPVISEIDVTLRVPSDIRDT